MPERMYEPTDMTADAERTSGVVAVAAAERSNLMTFDGLYIGPISSMGGQKRIFEHEE